MQFSIRQLATIVLFIGMALALTLSLQRTSNLEHQLSKHLNLPKDGNAEYYGLTMVGTTLENSRFLVGTHILRIQNHSKYRLELNFYDPKTGEKKQEYSDLLWPLTSIAYSPEHPDAGQTACFWIEDVHSANTPAEHVFWIPSLGESMFHPIDNVSAISDLPIMYYFFAKTDTEKLSKALVEPPETIDEIVSICNEKMIQSAYFRIVPRPGG